MTPLRPSPKPRSQRNDAQDPKAVPGYRVRLIYARVPPLRPLLDHLGIHDLAHDRASDWLDCNDQSERDQIANRYRKELKSAVMWGTAAIALDTALHTLLAQISIWGLTATTAAFHLATDYPWESAVVVGVVVTIWRLRRR